MRCASSTGWGISGTANSDAGGVAMMSGISVGIVGGSPSSSWSSSMCSDGGWGVASYRVALTGGDSIGAVAKLVSFELLQRALAIISLGDKVSGSCRCLVAVGVYID